MLSVWSRLQALWCQAVHPAPMWPVKGRYQCPTCFRSYRVPWESDRSCASVAGTAPRRIREAAVPSAAR